VAGNGFETLPRERAARAPTQVGPSSAGVIEMLLQSQIEELHLLPALPVILPNSSELTRAAPSNHDSAITARHEASHIA
jgi:hypothetical protein